MIVGAQGKQFWLDVLQIDSFTTFIIFSNIIHTSELKSNQIIKNLIPDQVSLFSRSQKILRKTRLDKIIGVHEYIGTIGIHHQKSIVLRFVEELQPTRKLVNMRQLRVWLWILDG